MKGRSGKNKIIRLLVKSFILIFIIGVYFYSNTSDIQANICADGYSCTSTSQTQSGWYFGDLGHGELGCYFDNYTYTCNGQDNNCLKDNIRWYLSESDCDAAINKQGPKGCCLLDGGGPGCTATTCDPVGFTSCEVDVGSGFTSVDTGVCAPVGSCPLGWNGVKHNECSEYNTCEKIFDMRDNCGDDCGDVTITCWQESAEITCPARCSSSYKYVWIPEWGSGPDGICGSLDVGENPGWICDTDTSERDDCTCLVGSDTTRFPDCAAACCTPSTTCDCSPDFYTVQTPNGGSRTSAPCSDGCGGTITDTCYCKLPNEPSCPVNTSKTNRGYGYDDEYCSGANNCGVRNCIDCYCSTFNTASCPAQYSSSNLGFGSAGIFYSAPNLCGYQDDVTCYCKSIPAAPLCEDQPLIGDKITTDNFTDGTGYYGFYNTLFGSFNDCGLRNHSDCWCHSECEPNPCPANTSETFDIGGSVSINCRNECNDPNDRTCYWICEEAKCANIQDYVGSEVDWQDTCPSGDCEEYTSVVPIVPVFGACPNAEVRTCYYPNIDPTVESIDVEPAEDNSVLGYTSNSYSGTDLNNPVEVTAIYEDLDQTAIEKDIKALYVWWSTSDNKAAFSRPTNLDEVPNLSGRLENNSNFGIMIRRNDAGVWGDVYIPHMGATDYWTEAGNISENLYIKGTGSQNIIKISDITVSDNGNQSILRLNMTFLTDPDIVNNGAYHLWGSVNDRVGFDPFNDNVIRKNDYWIRQNASGWDGTIWNIDMDYPTAENIEIVFIDEQLITVTLNGQDNRNLARARLDACKDDTPQPLTVIGGNDYNLSPCIGFNLDNLNGGSSMSVDNSQTSLLYTDGYINPPVISLNNLEKNINLNANEGGSITFYLRVMDQAGNYHTSPPKILQLGDWAIVEGALVYGGNGTKSETRPLADTIDWSSPHPLNPFVPPEEADLSDQALLGGGITIDDLKMLQHPSENQSFKATRFAGVNFTNVYTELTEGYEFKSDNPDFTEIDLGIDANISGSLTSPTLTDTCASEYCILSASGSVTIDQDFNCDAKGLIIVDGTVTLTPDFINDTSDDACIILSSGNITVTGGTNLVNPDYDTLEVFLISAGDIILEPEDDGLYIEGGLLAIHGDIENGRNLTFQYVNINPVIAVKSKSKYGLLGKTFFGSQIDIFKTEVGFKPY